MNRMQLPAALISSMTFFRRSSNSPRYFVPATSEPMSSVSRRLPCSVSGTLPGDDAVRQPFDDRRLADARLADEHRIVLRPPRQDLDDALDLVVPPDDRVELARARGRRQVHAQLVDGRRSRRRPAGRLSALRHALRKDACRLGAHALQVDAQALQDAGGNAFALADEAQQQVLGADVVMVQPARFVDGKLDDLLRPRREAYLAHRRTLAAADDELDCRAHLVQLDAQVGEHLGGYAVPFTHQAQQEVLSTDVVVIEPLSLFLGKR